MTAKEQKRVDDSVAARKQILLGPEENLLQDVKLPKANNAQRTQYHIERISEKTG